jgi:CelD/BcsL family acetyltransferase involved in cellulose biosynthesis
MEVLIHKRIESLQEIMPQWKKLNDNFQEITVFQEMDYMKNWWEHTKKSKEIAPYIVEIRENNETIGIIPLYLTNRVFANIQFRILRPIGFGESNYLVPILAKNHLPERLLKKAMDRVYEDKKNWDCLQWGNLPENSRFDYILNNESLIKPKLKRRKKIGINPRIVLDNDIKKVLEKCNQKFLKDILYRERKLEKGGKIKYHTVENEQEIDPIMNKFFEFHCKRWESTSTPSVFKDTKNREYIMRIVYRLFKNNLLYLSYLTHNDNIIVVHYGAADGKTNYLYLHAIDTEYSRFSVGHLLTYYLIQHSCNENYEVVDFLEGGEEYKQKWGPVNVYNLEYLLFNYSVKSLLFKMINNTYYSKGFSKLPKFKQLIYKSVIRGCTFILAINGKLIKRFNHSTP